jgi:mannose-6-phosphate isomerase-like protein (cupin superfamily)
MNWSRRDFSLLVPALAAAADAAAQDKKVLPAKAYRYEDLPVKENGQNKSRAVLDGATHSGFPVEVHMTTLGSGQMPHPPHHHIDEEMLMLRTGRLDVTMGGETTRVTAGSVVYVASMLEHGWKNPGPDAAEYFIIALGNKKG